MQCDLETSVPDWVIEYPQSLGIFQKLGIDYSCGGISLDYACQQAGQNAQLVLQQLHQAIVADREDDTGASSS
jgi:iron-sulfur cluster repair protein YtfE (RIC family)